jgi:flavin reductase (DIM6/NTAB) family NADH-FMN oxidoreductase RutF
MIMALDQAALRKAFGMFATGVCVATVRDSAGAAHGITVNSFTSVSLNPALVLWCLGDASERFDLFSASPHYAIHVLAAGDEARAMRFAGKGDQTLAADETETWQTGAPVLKGVMAAFDCTVVDRVRAGDHLLLIGAVERFAAAPGQDGLTSFQSRFGHAPAPALSSN